MSDLAARYFRAAQGCLDLPVSDAARLLLAWLYQSPSRSVTPGLCRIGPAGLAEEIGWTVAKVRRCLLELKGYVLIDEAARATFIFGAVRNDPPRNDKQIVAWARQLNQIPFCAPVAVAASEIEASIKNFDKSLIDKWRALYCHGNSLPNSSDNSNSPIPTPIPIHTHTQVPTPTPVALRAVPATSAGTVDKSARIERELRRIASDALRINHSDDEAALDHFLCFARMYQPDLDRATGLQMLAKCREEERISA